MNSSALKKSEKRSDRCRGHQCNVAFHLRSTGLNCDDMLLCPCTQTVEAPKWEEANTPERRNLWLKG